MLPIYFDLLPSRELFVYGHCCHAALCCCHHHLLEGCIANVACIHI